MIQTGPMASGTALGSRPRVLRLAADGADSKALSQAAADLPQYEWVESPVAAPQDAARLVRSWAPQVLMIDSAVLQRLGQEPLLAMRTAMPELPWMLSWTEPSRRWLSPMLGLRMRGAVSTQAPAAEVSRALDAVTAGRTWFPRAVTDWLITELGADAVARADAAHGEELGLRASSTLGLTEREGQVLALVKQGLSNPDIAKRLGVSLSTVKKHLARVYAKRGIRSRRQVSV